MTFVFAMHCTDGVVMVADRRLTKWDRAIEHREKMFVYPGVALAYAGAESRYHDFYFELGQRVSRLGEEGDQRPLDEFHRVTEQAWKEVGTRRPTEDHPETEVAIAVQTNRGAMLFRVTEGGALQPIQGCMVLGGADPFVDLFLKQAQEKGDLSMAQAAKLGYFCVRLLHHFDLVEGVGLAKTGPRSTPQVVALPDREGLIKQVTSTELEAWCKERLGQLEAFLDGLLE